MDEQKIAVAGDIICIGAGGWYYRVIGLCVVLKDFDPNQELEIYLEAHPKERREAVFDEKEYFLDLIKRGVLKEINYWDYNLGDPSFDEIEFTKK